MEMILDEGYQFGLGVFETICLEHTHPLLLSWHLERMNRSLKILGIDQEVRAEEVLAYLEEQKKDGKIPALHGLKIMASNQNKLFALRANPYTPEVIQKGFILDYSKVYRNETSPLVSHKTMNYGDCIWEKRHAKALGIDELIFKNSRGEICEGTTTNIFFVRDGRILTPDRSCGLLPGILRRFVMESFPVEEAILREDDIWNMNECFVTNSLMGVMPVTSLAGKAFVPGPVTKQCMLYYEKSKMQLS